MEVRRLTLDEFGDARLAGYARDRVFVSPGWARLWEARGGRAVVWMAGDGGEPAAVLPGVEFGRGAWTRFFSMPDGCYGGVLYRDPTEEGRGRHQRELLETMAAHGYMRAWVFDFHGSIDRPTEACEPFPQNTTLVDISDPGWQPPDRKLVSQIRKARREGIRVRSLDWERDGDRFLRLMRDTERRHGSEPRLGPAFFERLARLSGTDQRVLWKWCERDGRAACSHIYVVEQRVLQGWRIDFDKAFSFLKPNQFIRFHTCREMARVGVRRLNLGGSPEQAPGLRYFKRRWGGEPVRYRGYRLENAWGRLARLVRRVPGT